MFTFSRGLSEGTAVVEPTADTSFQTWSCSETQIHWAYSLDLGNQKLTVTSALTKLSQSPLGRWQADENVSPSGIIGRYMLGNSQCSSPWAGSVKETGSEKQNKVMEAWRGAILLSRPAECSSGTTIFCIKNSENVSIFLYRDFLVNQETEAQVWTSYMLHFLSLNCTHILEQA